MESTSGTRSAGFSASVQGARLEQVRKPLAHQGPGRACAQEDNVQLSATLKLPAELQRMPVPRLHMKCSSLKTLPRVQPGLG